MTLESVIQWTGGLLAYSTLGILLYGIWRGTQRKAGRVTGLNGSWLSSPWFYLALTLLFFGISYFGWIPLVLSFSPQTHGWLLILGALFYFPGILHIIYPMGTSDTWKILFCLDWF